MRGCYDTQIEEDSILLLGIFFVYNIILLGSTTQNATQLPYPMKMHTAHAVAMVITHAGQRPFVASDLIASLLSGRCVMVSPYLGPWSPRFRVLQFSKFRV